MSGHSLVQGGAGRCREVQGGAEEVQKRRKEEQREA